VIRPGRPGIGEDTGPPVTFADDPPFAFDGEIEEVVVEIT